MTGTYTSVQRPKVLIVAGYFDWFSGYQETAIARAMASLADTHVLASNLVSPIFSDEHLAHIGVPRRYPVDTRVEHGVTITRLPSRELRSMVWAPSVPRTVTSGNFDLVVQVMPGQLLPALASLARAGRRVVLYGDNKAMYASLPAVIAAAKFAVFCVTKGALYTAVNLRAHRIYGYTTDTIRRLRAFHPRTAMSLFPLTYDESRFFYSEHLRESRRAELGFTQNEIVLLAAGKVNAQKRLDLLIEAFDEAQARDPRMRLVLAGLDNESVSQSLRNDIQRRQITSRVTLLPFVSSDQLNALFNASDLGIWPRMPAVTIQQAMGTGLDVLIPKNDFTDHLFSTGLRSHELEQTSPDKYDDETLTRSINAISAELPRPKGERRLAASQASDVASARALCKKLLL